MRQLEFLETNGSGGFACGAINGELQRFWHGLLWVARKPPRDRVRLLAGLEESIDEGDGARHFLCAHWADGRWIETDIAARFDAFPVPAWTWYLPGGGILTKQLFMPPGSRSVVRIGYRLEGATGDCTLRLRPLLPHSARAEVCGESRWRFYGDGSPEVFLSVGGAGDAAITGEGFSLGAVDHQIERSCVDDPRQEVFAGPEIVVTLRAGSAVDFAFSADEAALSQPPFEAALGEEIARRNSGQVCGIPASASRLSARLSHAADQFLTKTDAGASTIMAGYPWFTDWGRDAMIALPGLCLATGRVKEAREIILHFAGYMSRGVIPNLFPEAGDAPRYNTVDATLWLVESAFRAWSLPELKAEEGLWNKLKQVIFHHEFGTHNDTRLDKDGLLRAGSLGSQLTWMDVKVNGEVPTPRHGKAVEIQGLWYNALLHAAAAAHEFGEGNLPIRYRAMAEQARLSFAERFFADDGAIADVVDRDGDGSADFSIRPNAVICFGLPHNIIPPARRADVLRRTAKHLLTARGLRTLSPIDPNYRGIYAGNVLTRDRAYHQGTVWLWLLGPYVKGVIAEKARAPELFAGIPAIRAKLFEHFESEGCINQANEIFDGDPPHEPRGCFAQTWSVAAMIEILGADIR
ncbi:amylo-alpha-1,6-glucosidase [soil metagenome]